MMAAASKAVASTITYPFSLAKARAQTSSKPPVNKDSAIELKHEAEHAENKAEAEKTARDAKNLAKKSTVFNTILHIYRNEGPAALYEGVIGEILKGFFSHGITMLLKEAIHKLIIQAYYMILKALKKYPNPSDIAAQAGEVIQDAGEKAGEIVKDGYENVSGRVGGMVQDGREAVGTAGERLGVMGNNASEAAKTAEDYVSKDAGHLLGNAREQLGDKTIDAEKGIKSED